MSVHFTLVRCLLHILNCMSAIVLFFLVLLWFKMIAVKITTE